MPLGTTMSPTLADGCTRSMSFATVTDSTAIISRMISRNTRPSLASKTDFRLSNKARACSARGNASGGQQEQGDGMQDQTCRTSPPTLVWPADGVAHLIGAPMPRAFSLRPLGRHESKRMGNSSPLPSRASTTSIFVVVVGNEHGIVKIPRVLLPKVQIARRHGPLLASGFRSRGGLEILEARPPSLVFPELPKATPLNRRRRRAPDAASGGAGSPLRDRPRRDGAREFRRL